ncbi:hypothetical protein BGY98DRAFT_1101359 [Russula aff. rugulosa BPL654]|nr:hypothetical protein BGY98DRAFT_1101359 [Russula aff. rugulosa BPL654]
MSNDLPLHSNNHRTLASGVTRDDGGLESDMWKLYLNEVNEDDQRMAGVWKEDAKVFFCLHFLRNRWLIIIEFYKNLIPNSNSNTANQPFSPSAAMIWWARGYIETPKSSIELKRLEILPTLVHLSVYLFFGGLVITFHTINKKVAIAVYVSAGLSGLVYIALTTLPCLMSSAHFAPLYPRYCGIHGTLSLYRSAFLQCITPEDFTKTQWRYLKYGLEKSIVKHNNISKRDGDQKMVIPLFSLLALGDKKKILEFAASIPRDRVLELLPPSVSEKCLLRESLVILLRSSAPVTGATGPDEGIRKRSLLVCLDAIYNISKTHYVSEPDFVLADLADIGLMRTLWDDSDNAIRVTSRSICALNARRLVNRSGGLKDDDLRWLEDVIGETAHHIFHADLETLVRMNFKSYVYGVLSSSNEVDDLPIESFKETLAILLNVQTGQETDVHFTTDTSRNRLSEEVGRLQRNDVVYRLQLVFPFLPRRVSTPVNQPES